MDAHSSPNCDKRFSSVTLAVIMANYTLLSDGKQKTVEANPLINVEAASRWVTYLCLSKIGYGYFADNCKTAHAYMSSKEFMIFTQGENFKKFVNDRIKEADKKYLKQKLTY